jgi:hypothetical protein
MPASPSAKSVGLVFYFQCFSGNALGKKNAFKPAKQRLFLVSKLS